MTAPEARSSGIDGNARGLIVLFIALAVGFLLLLNGGVNSNAGESASNGSGSTPNTTAPLDDGVPAETTTTTTPTPATGRAPGEVKALVLNGGGPAGSAVSTSTTIGEAGYVMGEAGNSAIQVTETTFFFVEEYQEDATAIALLLGKSPDAVKPLAEAGLGGVEGDNNVVVVLGPDIPAVAGN